MYWSYPILPFRIFACTFFSDNVSRNSCIYILNPFSSETPVIFSTIDFENEYQTFSLVLNKPGNKSNGPLNFAIMYGNFCSLDLCLHNQIVHDAISSLANKFERWNVHMRMGWMSQSPSTTKIFLKFERLSEDISNSKSKQTRCQWLGLYQKPLIAQSSLFAPQTPY